MGLRSGLAYLAYGPGNEKRNAGVAAHILPFFVAPSTPAQPQRSSWAYDAHIVTTEAASFGKVPQTLSLAWDERDAWGLDLASRSWQGLTPTERKSILLDIYINNPHVSSSVDVISKRIFSGGFTVEKVNEESKDNQAHYDQLMEFCLRVNPDWDFNQYGRASVQDELIYGECYTEILWKNGLPFNLVKVDCLTMGYKPDRYGRIDRFYQEMPSTSQINYLDPKNIIRWWFPHPRASVDPFAPAEKVSDAVLLDKKMINWMITFFQKGARFQYYIKGLAGQDEADRFMAWFDQNVSGAKNAHRPPATWGNAEFAPLGNAGALEMDFQKGLDRMETIVYGAYGVPPAAVAIIKVGALGGNSGEDQDKSLIFNACDPVKQQWLEKLNYRVVQQGFHINDYRIGTRYADYRSDESVSKVEDTRIKNGSRTVDEIRQESGKRPYKQGGSVPFVWSSKEITPLPRLDDLASEQQQTAQVGLDTQKAQLDKIKNPPPVPPALQQPGQPGQAQNQQQQGKQPPASKTANTASQKQQQAKETFQPVLSTQPETVDEFLADLELLIQQPIEKESEQHNTGMMLAFLLDQKTAEQLALPSGEPASDLHITLAYLGDTEDEPVDDGMFRAHLAPNKIKDAVAGVASQCIPMTGKIQGIGRFSAPDGDPTPVYAAPDVPGLAEFRTKLVTAVEAAGYYVAHDHDFTPHITLAYIDASAPMPIKEIPAIALNLNTVSLVIGDNQYDFKLTGDDSFDDDDTLTAIPAIKLPKQESNQQLANIWQPPDIDARIALLKSHHVATKEWVGDASMCDAICAPNHKHIVGVDEQFPSGHVDTPGHPHCGCHVIYRDKDGNEVQVPDSYGSDYQ